MRLRMLAAIVVLASTCVVACRRCDPSRGDRIVVDAAGATTPSLDLSVFIATDGFHVISLGANLAPGCATPGPGPTVPNKDGAYDFAGLTACAVTLKGRPAGAGTAVTIAGTPATKYQTLVSTMDALRKSEEKELFPEVTFGMARSEPQPNKASPSSAPLLAAPSTARAPATGPARPPIPPGPKPTITTSSTSEDGVAVLVSKSLIIVDDQPVAPIPSDAELGLEAKYKRNGRTDLYIVPLANVLVAWRERDKQVRAATGKDPSFSEAILIADGNTPYRLVVEVLFTLGHTEFGKFHLMVLQGAAK
jgi:biopolymer transport protein ExbD